MTDTNGAVHKLRIGVFGVLPPQVTDWDKSRLKGTIHAEGLVDGARQAISDLRDQGADLIIALAHTGLRDSAPMEQSENAALEIAALPGLDALVAGHTHEIFPRDLPDAVPGADGEKGTLHGVPAVMPGFAGSHLGVIDLHMVRGKDGWTVERATSGLHEVLAPPDPALRRRLRAAHQDTLDKLNKPLGHLATPLDTRFAIAADVQAVRVVAEAQAAHVRKALASTEWASLPVLSATAPFKSGGRGGPEFYTVVAPGPFSLRHVVDLQYYPNDISAILLSGAQIADWVEMAASAYATVAPGAADVPLRNPQFPGYNCDTIFGLKYEIDLSVPARFDSIGRVTQPESRRVRNIRHDGKPLLPQQDYVLAANTYRTGGGGHYPHAVSAPELLRERTEIRQILADYLSEVGPTLPKFRPAWHFSAIKGASAIFETAPDIPESALPDWLNLTALDITSRGFQRYRLHLG